MISKATLKKPWRTHKGKVYPAGTTFIFVKKFIEIESALYDFVIPGECYGLVVIPDKVFRKLTSEERELRERRRKDYEDHMKKYNDRLWKTNW